MRIVLSFLQSEQTHPIPPYGFWPGYLRNGLAEGGHEVLEVPGADWAEGLVHAAGTAEHAGWAERTWDATVRYVRAEHAREPVDLFLSYLFPSQVDAAGVAAVQALGVPCVNFYCDNVRDFRRVPAAFRPFDLHWVPEAGALAMYRAAGLPAVFAPMPCWVAPALRTWDHPERHGPTFVGSRDEPRAVLFAQALPLAPRLELRGRGWAEPHPRRPAPPPAPLAERLRRQLAYARDEGLAALVRRHTPDAPAVPAEVFASAVRPAPGPGAYAETLQQAEVVVGVNRYASHRYPAARPHAYSRLRDIEAPMLGACYLTEACEGLDQMFDLGAEIAVYRTPEELASELGRLAADPPLRRAMRRAAQARALRELSIPRTLATLADALGIPADAGVPR